MTGLTGFITARLADLGIEHGEFAKQVGISPSHLSNILNNRKQSNAKTRHKIPLKSATLWADCLRLTGEPRLHFLFSVLKQLDHPVITEVLESLEDALVGAEFQRGELAAQFAADRARFSAQIAELSLLIAGAKQKIPKNGKSDD